MNRVGDTLYWVDEDRAVGPGAKLWVRSGVVVTPDHERRSYCVMANDTGRIEWVIGQSVFNSPEMANVWALGTAVRFCLNFNYKSVEVYQWAGGQTSATPVIIPSVFHATGK